MIFGHFGTRIWTKVHLVLKTRFWTKIHLGLGTRIWTKSHIRLKTRNYLNIHLIFKLKYMARCKSIPILLWLLIFWIISKTRDKLIDEKCRTFTTQKQFKKLNKIKEEAKSETNGTEGIAAALGKSDSVNFISNGTMVLQSHQVGCGLDGVVG